MEGGRAPRASSRRAGPPCPRCVHRASPSGRPSSRRGRRSTCRGSPSRRIGAPPGGRGLRAWTSDPRDTPQAVTCLPVRIAVRRCLEGCEFLDMRCRTIVAAPFQLDPSSVSGSTLAQLPDGAPDPDLAVVPETRSPAAFAWYSTGSGASGGCTVDLASSATACVPTHYLARRRSRGPLPELGVATRVVRYSSRRATTSGLDLGVPSDLEDRPRCRAQARRPDRQGRRPDRDEDFGFERLEQSFDFALAQSVFTHLPANKIVRCLMNIERRARPRRQVLRHDLPE